MSETTLPDHTSQALQQLKAARSPADAARLGPALKLAKERGWSYKQLGEAVGASHEWVRKQVLKTPADAPGPGIDIPERARPRRTVPVRHAPPSVLDELAALLQAAVDAEANERTAAGFRPAVAELHKALADAIAAGWSPHGIGPAIGMHPRAVTRFAAVYERSGAAPDPDRFPKAPRTEPEPVLTRARPPAVPEQTIPDADVERLRSLGTNVNANVDRKAAAEYTRLLAYWYLRGARRAELERASGQEWEAIRFRLSYWGFMGASTA